MNTATATGWWTSSGTCLAETSEVRQPLHSPELPAQNLHLPQRGGPRPPCAAGEINAACSQLARVSAPPRGPAPLPPAAGARGPGASPGRRLPEGRPARAGAGGRARRPGAARDVMRPRLDSAPRRPRGPRRRPRRPARAQASGGRGRDLRCGGRGRRHDLVSLRELLRAGLLPLLHHLQVQRPVSAGRPRGGRGRGPGEPSPPAPAGPSTMPSGSASRRGSPTSSCSCAR